MKTCAVVVAIVLVVSFSAFMAAAITFGVLDHHATPTSVAVASTSAARSTPTPAARKSGITAEQKAYLAQINKDGEVLQESTAQLAPLMQQASVNPTLIHDPTWKGSVAVILSSWQTIYNGAASNNAPPAGLDAVNGQWVDILGRFNRAASDYASGLDQADGTLIAQGNTEVTDARILLGQLATLIQDFENQHN